MRAEDTASGTAGAPQRSRTDEAYRVLKDEIMENRMPPGFQAMEAELAEQLGISRTPVREAAIRLSAEGLVEIRRRRGMRVLPISVEDMREIYELLTILEAECARRLALSGLSSSQLGQLEHAVVEMETALTVNALDAWALADNRFHRLHLEFVTNRRLAKMIGQLLDQAHRARMFTLHLRARPMRSTEDHRRMVETLHSGDAAGISRLYREHREQAAAELIEILGRYKLHYL